MDHRHSRSPSAPGCEPFRRHIHLVVAWRLGWLACGISEHDILHIHCPVSGGQAIPALAARLAGVRATIATYHQIQPVKQPFRTRSINAVTHAVLVDATLAVSRAVRETLIRASGMPSRKITTIHNGIDAWEPADEAQPDGLPSRDKGEVRIGYFGRLSPEKGVADLVESLALLRPGSPQARTLIVGDGPSRSSLEALVSGLGLTDSVHFLGFRSDARAIMRCVDIVAHVPVYEGFGLVLLEAMAARRPVVTNDAPGGLTEIVAHEDTGLIVPAGARQRLAEALARLVGDPEARQRLRANCQRYLPVQYLERHVHARHCLVRRYRRLRARPQVQV